MFAYTLFFSHMTHLKAFKDSTLYPLSTLDFSRPDILITLHTDVVSDCFTNLAVTSG